MASQVFDFLNDPQLVATFQKTFGVTYKTDENNEDGDNLSSAADLQRKSSGFYDASSTLLEDYDNSVAHGYNLRSRKYQGHRRSLSEYSTASSKDADNKDYVVRWPFFYYLFHIGAGLGNEMFYCCFFPYWFWNVDGYVCRRLVLTWCLIMYVGQALKDIIRLPRPASPPVVRMEKRYELEYGMPSTHAMIGLAFPWAFLYFTIQRYEVNSNTFIALGVIWCLCVCLSRLYLGMHSVADVIAGLALATLLMFFIIPALDIVDEFQLKHPYAPIVMIIVTVLAALMYPRIDEWSTCRGDTMLILGVQVGVALASWMNYQNNFIPHDAEALVGSPPYHVKTPDLEWAKMALLRMVIGYSSLFLTRAMMKQMTYKLSCWLYKLNPEEYEKNKKQMVVELPYKYLTYCAISLNVVYLSPLIFRYFDIERPTVWTEL
ncbi:sphingosine-1-phosphate phosphatase 2-like isoform X2 [Watersipora subatra]|uniref:sphingosine-1-phosphate phosphatase 2-like isoform X2 n=1 Tax=Watersipora subatra TaxID=2589382 RepID=UPI00355B74E6